VKQTEFRLTVNGNAGYCAAVAEAEADTEIWVRRLWLAVDVGRLINPDGVRSPRDRSPAPSATRSPARSGYASATCRLPASA
jgi:hypothetical protein